MGHKSSRAFRTKDFTESLSDKSLDILCQLFYSETIDLNDFKSDFDNYYNILDLDKKKYFELINEIGTETAMPHLVKVCKKYNVDFDYSDLTPADLATMLLKYYPKAIDEAYSLYNIDSIDNFVDYKGKDSKKPFLDEFHLHSFQKALEDYLKEQAKGKIETTFYEYENKTVLIVNYGDYNKTLKVQKNNNFENINLRPVKDITLLYYKNEKKVRIKALTQGIKDKVIELVAKHLFEDANFFNNLEYNFFELTKIFELQEESLNYNPEEIELVKVKELTAFISTKEDKQITFKSNDDVIKVIEEKYNRDEIIPIKVKIAFKLKDFGRQNRRTIEISALSNKSNINDSPRDELILKYLIKWGIAKID